MKEILAVTAIVTLMFGNAAYAAKTHFKYETRRSVETGMQFDVSGRYVSLEVLTEDSVKEACQEAIAICQSSEGVQCGNYRPSVRYRDSGYALSGADITCAADRVEVLSQNGQAYSWLGLFNE